MFFLKIAIIQSVALITPGPDFFFIVQTATSQSVRQAMYGVVGIVIGCLLWCLLAMLGLHSILATNPWLGAVIGLLGGSYLAWLGYSMLKYRNSGSGKQDSTPGKQFSSQQTWGFLIKGLFTNLSNPKAIIYFASVLSLAITEIDSWVSGSIIVFLICFETLVWFSLVAVVFSYPKFKQHYLNYSSTINLIAGVIFILFALSLLYSSLLQLW